MDAKLEYSDLSTVPWKLQCREWVEKESLSLGTGQGWGGNGSPRQHGSSPGQHHEETETAFTEEGSLRLHVPEAEAHSSTGQWNSGAWVTPRSPQPASLQWSSSPCHPSHAPAKV